MKNNLYSRKLIASLGAILLGSVPVNQAKAQTVVMESGGVVVMDVEQTAPATGWMSDTRISGYLGSSYYVATAGARTRHANFMDGMMEYWFTVTTPGNYQLQWRSCITDGAGGFGASHTDENDSFARLVDVDGNPMTPVANDLKPDTNQWHKIYMNTVRAWSWAASNHDHNPRAVFWSLQAGQTYRLQVHNRSRGHAIDRILLWNQGSGVAYANIEGTPSDAQNASADALLLSLPVGGVD